MVISQLIVARDALAQAMDEWDDGEPKNAPEIFLLILAGPYVEYDQWIDRLGEVARHGNRELFEHVAKQAATEIILGWSDCGSLDIDQPLTC